MVERWDRRIGHLRVLTVGGARSERLHHIPAAGPDEAPGIVDGEAEVERREDHKWEMAVELKIVRRVKQRAHRSTETANDDVSKIPLRVCRGEQVKHWQHKEEYRGVCRPELQVAVGLGGWNRETEKPFHQRWRQHQRQTAEHIDHGAEHEADAKSSEYGARYSGRRRARGRVRGQSAAHGSLGW